MSYETYNTEAIVCGSYDRGAADRAYHLFTRDAGMLLADARSAREERSRQRYALQDCAVLRVSLVKGKSGWRIGSVESIAQPFLGATERTARATTVRVVQVLRRFLRGSEAAPDIYADAVALLAAPEHTDLIEPFLLRTLYRLGYVAETPAIAPILHAATLADCRPLLAAAPDLAPIITNAEEVSQL